MIHISHQHKAVIVKYRADVAALFPHALRLQYDGTDMLAMPHGLDETRMLRNLDLNVPAPIVEHYNYPGDQRPFDKQVLTTALMTMNPRAYVLNKMGTGKTKAALWAFDYLRTQGRARKMLVAAPLSTLSFVWEQEAVRTLHGCRVQILHGDAAQRLKRLRTEADIYVVNHDGLKLSPLYNELMRRRDIDTICIDEAAVFRNAKAVMSKAAQAVCQERAWVWGMTGSPTPTAPTDAFGLSRLITPQRSPRSFTHFRQETMLQVSQFKWVPRSDAAQVVAKLLQPSVCFSLDDVTELPPLIERVVPVAQGQRQRAAYKELQNNASVLLREGRITAQNGGIVLNKMLQISCGAVYMDDGGTALLDNDARLQAMIDIIESTDRKVIVFSAYKHVQACIEAALFKHKIDNALVNGSVAMGRRNEVFTAFQNTDRISVLNAHPECMAHGLTLTAADTIIWFGPIASLEIYEQANARIRRVGQTAKQQVFKLQGTTAERATYARLDQRRSIQDTVLDLLSDITRG
jgi:SNF2 family DNA or RNA helicase